MKSRQLCVDAVSSSRRRRVVAQVRKHAEVVLGCQGWRLEADEVAVLDAVLPAAPPTFQRKKFLQ